MTQAWRPIETAPFGEDDFYLVCSTSDPDSHPFVVRGSILANALKDNTPKHLRLDYLTHWMPLPPMPEYNGGDTPPV